MVDKIEVFPSSHQDEFSAERIRLQRIISKIPYVKCRPLETRGAIPESAPRASVKAVNNSHIYVGIFGVKYSKVTQMEFNAAFRRHKPRFIYLKKVKTREKKLTAFINERIKPQFIWQYYETKSELYKTVRENLQDYLLELLQMGLAKYKEQQKRALNRDKAARKRSVRAIIERKEDVPSQILTEAKQAIKTGDLMSAILKASISFETWLRLNLIKKADVRESKLKGKPLGYLLDLATERKLLSSGEMRALRKVQHIRNRLLHEGKTPTKKDVEWDVKTVSEVIKEPSRR